MNSAYALDRGQVVPLRCTGCAGDVAPPFTTLRDHGDRLLAFPCPACDREHEQSPRFRDLVERCAMVGRTLPEAVERWSGAAVGGLH